MRNNKEKVTENVTKKMKRWQTRANVLNKDKITNQGKCDKQRKW